MMGLINGASPVMTDICWHCSGTGRRFAGVAPIRFRRCPICYGEGGRRVARHAFFVDNVCEKLKCEADDPGDPGKAAPQQKPNDTCERD